MSAPVSTLLARCRAGDRRALAQAISVLESDVSPARAALTDAGATGVNIEFGTELTGLTQDRAHDDGEDQDRCVVDVARDGVADQIRAAYVVGADGRSGTTRAFACASAIPGRYAS